LGHKWKSKFGGTEVSEAKRLRELEAENRKLKHLLADSMLDVVTPQAKRLVVSSLMSSQDLSQRRACQLANLHRSTYHYQTKQPARDVALRVRMKQLATLHSAYGYLILHALLKQEGLVVNKNEPIGFIPKKAYKYVQSVVRNYIGHEFVLNCQIHLMSVGRWTLFMTN